MRNLYSTHQWYPTVLERVSEESVATKSNDDEEEDSRLNLNNKYENLNNSLYESMDPSESTDAFHKNQGTEIRSNSLSAQKADRTSPATSPVYKMNNQIPYNEVYNELLGPHAFADQLVDIDFAAIEVSNLPTNIPEGLIIKTAYQRPEDAQYTHFNNTVFPQMQYYREAAEYNPSQTTSSADPTISYGDDKDLITVTSDSFDYQGNPNLFYDQSQNEPTVDKSFVNPYEDNSYTAAFVPDMNSVKEVAVDADINQILRDAGISQYMGGEL